MEKIITPSYQISGKRKKLVGYVGELRDGDTLIHSMEYSTQSQAETALDALAFEILTDMADQGLVDELPAFDPSTCCFCHKPHAAQKCPEMRAMLFAPFTDVCVSCGDQLDWDAPLNTTCGACQEWINPSSTPLDVDFATFGPEVS